ncbi:MAG: hypothetical protein MJ213_04475 [Bacilli bacterium]|nr:hypothetical protein [Bacilli bacterium]
MNFVEECKKHLECYNKNVLKSTVQGVYRKHKYWHILPDADEYRKKNFLIPSGDFKFSGNLLYFTKLSGHKPIKLHSYGTHLNSSQVLCINFFYDFIKDKDKLQRLVNYFDIGNPAVESACFEYGLCDDSEIDFCILLKNKKRIYCEIKYTETFGGVSDEDNPKYKIKKNLCYKEAFISFNDYCKDYQFIRNVCAAKKDDSWAIFIFPKRNEKTLEHYNNCVKHLKNRKDFKQKNLFWEDLIAVFPNKKVKEKYFWYLND